MEINQTIQTLINITGTHNNALQTYGDVLLTHNNAILNLLNTQRLMVIVIGILTIYIIALHFFIHKKIIKPLDQARRKQ